MKPTEQQVYCLTTVAQEQMTKIKACAGAGKTSTLEYIAQNIFVKSLYLAFNKVTAVEAEERFPSHVTCKTTHSVAFSLFGVALMTKLSRPQGKYVNVAGTGSEIARYYSISSITSLAGPVLATGNAMGLYVKTTVERFEQSADMELSMKHVPKKDMEKVLREAPEAAFTVLRNAKRLWADRIDRSSVVLATHDTYLKLYQLSKPKLNYDIIFVDEFQDTTPCVLDIILNQVDTSKIVMVGDPRQAIYGWRGAINAMQSISCKEAPLSHSFRYGQAIADVATAVLHHDMQVMGRADIECKIGYGVIDKTKPYMYLFRTNALLLMEAVDAIDRGEKVKVEIDVKDFVKVLQSALALYKNEMKNVKHERILPYPTWAAMVEEAEEIKGETKRLVEIVEGQMADHIITVLENYRVPANASVIMTTAHKAKGREEDQVLLAADFPTNIENGEWKGVSETDENLLYVAVTRAKRVLGINKAVQEVMDKYKMKYLLNPDDEEVNEAFRNVIKQEQRMLRSIIHDDGLPF